MNKSLIATIITWLFILPFLWFGWINYSKLSNAKQNIVAIEGFIDKVECKKLYKSNHIKITMYYKYGESLMFFPQNQNNLSLQEHCNKTLNRYKDSKNFKAIFLSNSKSSTPLDLYIDSDHVLQFNEEIQSRKESTIYGIMGALFIGLFVTLMNFFVWHYKINTDRILDNKIFRWVLYSIAIFAIFIFIFS